AAAQETPCVEIALIVTLYFRGASPGPPWISITSVLFAHLCTGPAAANAPGVSAAHAAGQRRQPSEYGQSLALESSFHSGLRFQRRQPAPIPAKNTALPSCAKRRMPRI